MKRALITGVTGQDGSYLAEFLLCKGYKVYGLCRRKENFNYGNASRIFDGTTIIEGDLTNRESLESAVKLSRPDEVYNLAAQSCIVTSFKEPAATNEVNGLGVLNLLEAVRTIKPDAKIFQASSREIFGGIAETPYNEDTPPYPLSPYAVSKLYAHWLVKNYRESYGMFACAGILFNHESERRGKGFVTRKITSAAAAIARGEAGYLELGNLSAKRDWGHAEDYVRAMWLMLQQEKADEYIIATGETRTVREFAGLAFRYAGYDIRFEGEGVNEAGIDRASGKALIKVNPRFFRDADVHAPYGDPAKAKRVLGWERKVPFDALVRRMVENDLAKG
jgi:GDPmannose 4,6-dehydratase